ncbi:hypothetical protein M569_01977, partial [Genlisea aurea]
SMIRLPAVNAAVPTQLLSSGHSFTSVISSFFKQLSFSISPEPISPPESSSAVLCRDLFSILCRPNWPKDPSLKNFFHSISPPLFSSFLSQYPHLNPHVAFQFFRFLSSAPSFKPDVQAYASLLRFLVKNKSFRDADMIRISMIRSSETAEDVRLVMAMLREMNRGDDSEFSFRLTLKAYNMLLMSLARFVMIDDIKAVYGEMLDDKLSPNIYTFNTLINAYCKLGDVFEAEYFYSMILQADLKPDTHTFTSFILGYCRRKDVDAAREVFKNMPGKGCPRNHVSYNNLMHGLCESGRVDEAELLFSQMRDDGGCVPNERTYTILIDALCGMNRRSESLNLFREMKEKGYKPNVYSYTAMIDGACKEGLLDEATEFFREMLDIGLLPSSATYNALINGYCKKGMMDTALELFRSMESKKCIPNLQTYNELISGFCQSKEVNRAMALLDEMVQQGIVPNVITFNLLVYGQCKVGDVENALRLLWLMDEENIVPDQFTYGALIDALCKKGITDEAYSIFDSLKEKGVPMNEVMYTSLIDGHCNAEKFEVALFLFETMLEHGCHPNECTYNAMISGLCRASKLPEALKYLDRMMLAENGTKPTIVTYSIIIEQMLKEHDFEGAYRIFNDAIGLGLKPDVCTYTSFLLAYFNRGMPKEAEDLVSKMKEQGVKLDLMAYTVLIDGYGRSGSLDRSFDTMKSMVTDGIEPSQYTYAGRSGSVNITDVWKVMEQSTALELFDKMRDHGLEPDSNAYAAVIGGLCREGRRGEARSLFRLMERDGAAAKGGKNGFDTLIQCCCKMGIPDEASRLVDDMLGRGMLPRLESYGLLVCGFYGEGREEEARGTFRGMLRGGYNHDEVVWKVLIDGLMKEGFLEGCCELVVVMRKMGCCINPQTHLALVQGLV